MNSRVVSSMLAGITLLSLAGCGAYKDWTRPVGYEGTTVNADAVRERLTGEFALEPARFAVVTDRGQVFVSGWVDSDREKRRALEFANSVPGVSKVVDHLQVGAKHRPAQVVFNRGGSCSLVSDITGWFQSYRPQTRGVEIAMGPAVDVRVYRVPGAEDQTIPTYRPTHAATAADDDQADLLWTGSLKHREAIEISGPSMIRYSWDINGAQGEKVAACAGGAIYVP
jgi:hypothetical protein